MCGQEHYFMSAFIQYHINRQSDEYHLVQSNPTTGQFKKVFRQQLAELL